ncbi:MAG: amidophosphoribosyltransferase [Candidatus Omnitrophica bacterium]|nr:amidophosphoribosyltransferase [Candidatus Omnitrophota bacterium]
MCGIFGIYPHKDAAKLAYLGLFALQHRGEEAAGILSKNRKNIDIFKAPGLVNDVFNEKIINSLKGNLAIGHVRYSTTGSPNIKNIQPFYAKTKIGHIAVAHNGNFTNTLQLRKKLEDKGAIFQTTMDTELIVHLLVHSNKKDIKELVIDAFSQIKGAYSLVMLVDNFLVGAKDPYSFRPLCLGRLNGAYVFASESCALDLIGAEYIREIEPGEIVFVYKNNIESIKPFKSSRLAFCIFEYIYFSRPDSNIFGHNVYEVRKNLGRNLAKIYPACADLVIPVPDSGTVSALGYSEVSKIPFEYGLIRNHYISRTFIQPSQAMRDFKVKIKLNPLKEILRGKRIVVIEDSIVRGTTSKMRMHTLRKAGAKKIHMRVSSPPIKYPCFYGIDFPTKNELIAAKHDINWIKNFIGVDSLKYQRIEDMLNSVEEKKENFCLACFSGDYPVPCNNFSKKILEK